MCYSTYFQRAILKLSFQHFTSIDLNSPLTMQLTIPEISYLMVFFANSLSVAFNVKVTIVVALEDAHAGGDCPPLILFVITSVEYSVFAKLCRFTIVMTMF